MFWLPAGEAEQQSLARVAAMEVRLFWLLLLLGWPSGSIENRKTEEEGEEEREEEDEENTEGKQEGVEEEELLLSCGDQWLDVLENRDRIARRVRVRR